MRKKVDQLQRRKLLEEALRPSRVLGYDHLNLAQYLASVGAFGLAEKECRYAIYLNPFEPVFKLEHALALYNLGRMDEARAVLGSLREAGRCLKEVAEIWDQCWPEVESET